MENHLERNASFVSTYARKQYYNRHSRIRIISNKNNFTYDLDGYCFSLGGGTIYGISLVGDIWSERNYYYLLGAQSKKSVIYQRGDRRVRRVLRRFQPLLVFSDASALSVCSAVKFKDIAISLEKSTVPISSVLCAPFSLSDRMGLNVL